MRYSSSENRLDTTHLVPSAESLMLYTVNILPRSSVLVLVLGTVHANDTSSYLLVAVDAYMSDCCSVGLGTSVDTDMDLDHESESGSPAAVVPATALAPLKCTPLFVACA